MSIQRSKTILPNGPKPRQKESQTLNLAELTSKIKEAKQPAKRKETSTDLKASATFKEDARVLSPVQTNKKRERKSQIM